MDDDAGNIAQQMGAGDELIVGVEEAPVLKIVAFDAGKGDGVVVLAEAFGQRRIGEKRDRRSLPDAPGLGRLKLRRRV